MPPLAKSVPPSLITKVPPLTTNEPLVALCPVSVSVLEFCFTNDTDPDITPAYVPLVAVDAVNVAALPLISDPPCLGNTLAEISCPTT